MPYKSEAQRRKFHAMAARGEISKATVEHWDKASKGKNLPERVKKTRKQMRAERRRARRRGRGGRRKR